MFTKVLVANRGEIAVRVQQTLHVMGILTVSVYSDVDAAAPHVAMSDEAYPLNGNTAEETYLDIDKLLTIARTNGAQAIHPGYGFLSENPRFAQACQEADIVFVGPSPNSMEIMGDKIRSKELAKSVGVPVVPSSPVCDSANPELESFAKDAGFPLLVKAAAGGGGRGMRLVTEPEQLSRAMDAASREAQAAFGDGRVFLERYIPSPRHIEFQVLADSQGHVIHMLERECSIQRRHQKIIEETPSPALTPALRQRMGEAAVAVARAAEYVNAGTVEFLLDPDGTFYFLEMNARIQVEHPITEAVTGVDLVEWQLRIAAGERLTLNQDEIQPNGHAVECRIYAEDPYNDFLPSTGTLRHWQPPSGPGLRLDSGFVVGQDVSTFYDPMLAKLVAWGPDRSRSLRRMEEALRRFAVLGVVTNIPFMREIVAHSAFRDGSYDTRFIEEHPELLQPARAVELSRAAQAIASQAGNRGSVAAPVQGDASDADHRSPWHLAGHWRLP